MNSAQVSLSPPIQPVQLNFNESKAGICGIKFKINLKNLKESTAKLTDVQKKVYKIACTNVFWRNFEDVSVKKILRIFQNLACPSVFRQSANRFLDIQFDSNYTNQYVIHVTLLKQKPKLGILSIRNSKDLIQFCNQNKLKDQDKQKSVQTLLHDVAQSVFSSLDNLDCEERSAIFSFASRLVRIELFHRIIAGNPPFKQLVTALKFFRIMNPECIENITPIQNALILSLNQTLDSEYFQQNPELLLRDFARLDPLDQRQVVERSQITKKLFGLYRFASDLNSRDILDAFHCFYLVFLQQGKNLDLLRLGALKNPFSEKLRLLISQQIRILSDETRSGNVTDIVLSSSVIILFKLILFFTRGFNFEYDLINIFKNKIIEILTNKQASIGMLLNAKQAFELQNLLTSDFFKILPHTYKLNQPWQIFKCLNIRKPCEDLNEEKFFQALICRKGTEQAILYLHLIEHNYSKMDAVNLYDFKCFLEDVLDLSNEIKNTNYLPIHSHWHFVTELVQLLKFLKKSIEQEHPKISNLILKLLCLIRDNNALENEYKIFRIRDSERSYAEVRKGVTQNISDFLSSMEQQSELKENCIIPSQTLFHSFQKILEQKFPVTKTMQRDLEQLKNDAQFIEDKGQMLELKGSIHGEERLPLKQLLDERLSKEERSILILGEEAAGKTLFLKNYVQESLEKYQIGDPIIFYIPLNSLQGSRELMSESLKIRGLLEREYDLKQNHRTEWLIDGVEELIKREKKTFNFFEYFGLDEWPKASFVFSCQAMTLKVTDLRDYFAPSRGSVSTLTVAPFDAIEIDRFLEHFIKLRRANGKPVWPLEDYKQGINHLGFKQIVYNPLFIRKAIECLHTVRAGLGWDGEQIQDLLLAHWIAHGIKKHVQKYRINECAPSTYLGHLLNVSSLMNLCGVRAVFPVSKRRSDKDSQKKYQGLTPSEIKDIEFAENDLDCQLFGRKNQILKIRAFFKINDEGATEFVDPLLQDYLLECSNMGREYEIERLSSNDSMQN